MTNPDRRREIRRRKDNSMLFTWITRDGVTHEKRIEDKEERRKFIESLETSKDVIKWW